MRKIIAALLCIVMVLSLAACGNKPAAPAQTEQNTAAAEEVKSEGTPVEGKDYLKNFDNVEYTTVINTPAGDVLPDGQTVEDNLRSRYFTEVTGLVPKVVWSASGETFDQKLNMAIATGDIPDFFEVSYDQYLELVETEQLADLTEYIDILHPMLKECYESAGNTDLKAVTVDGKIYGIPKANGLGDSTPVLWVRQDWMEKLGVEEPTCIDDIAVIARAFMNGDPDGDGIKNTEGLSVRAEYKYPGGDGGLVDFFANYGAFLYQYNLQDDGSVKLGTIQPEALETLKLLNSWYNEGIIAKDFATVDATSYTQKVSSGKTGMFLGYWWDSWGCLTDCVVNDPDARWTAYCLPKNAGEDYITAEGDPASTYIGVVSKSVKDPSMFIYALNNFVEAMLAPDYGPRVAADAAVSNMYHPMHIFSLPADAIITTGVLASKYAAGEITLDQVREMSFPSEAEYNASMAECAKVVADNGGDPNASIADWSNSIGYTAAMMAEHNSNIQFHRSDFVGTTDTMEKKGTFLEKLVTEAYTKMIMGNTDGMTIDDYFDNFVNEYLKQGGQEILDEVTAALTR